MTYEFDVTAGSTPLGTILTTLGDADLLENSHFRVVRPGSGAGKVDIVISADNPKAALMPEDCYVRIRDTVLGSYVAAGLPIEASIKLISEGRDRRVLTRSGDGQLAYLRRMALLEAHYAPGQPQRGDVSLPGLWTWYGRNWGAIAVRAVEEGIYHPDSPLAALSLTFDRTQQTGGAPWTLADEEFQVRIGANVWDDLYRSLMAGGFIPVLSPNLVMDGYEQFGEDHSGAAYGADVVRFQVGANPTDLLANIMTDAERVWVASRLSSLLVLGKDNVTVVVNDATAPVKKVGSWSYPESSDPAILTAAGTAELARRALRSIGSLRVPVPLGDDPLTGTYRPGPGRPLWPGNTVTVFTGSAEYDISADMPVAAIDWRLSDARGWEPTAELGTTFIDRGSLSQERAMQQIVTSTVPRPHGHPELGCRPLQAVQPTVAYVGGWGSNGSSAINIPDGIPNSMLLVFGQGPQEFGGAPPWTATYGAETLTPVDDAVANGYTYLQAFYLLDPTPDPTQAGAALKIEAADLGTAYRTYVVVQDVDPADPIGSFVSALGTGSTQGPGSIPGGIGVLPYGAMFGTGGHASHDAPVAVAGLTSDYTHGASHYSLAAAGGHGDTSPQWTTLGSDVWVSIGFGINGIGSGGGEGHGDLTGTPTGRFSNCSHRHDVHRDSAPTVDDDETRGYSVGTSWAELDDLETPTEILAVWILADATEGAAVWLELPGGGVDAHGDLTGVTPNQHHNQDHASRHANGGADEVALEGLATAETDTALVPHPDGTGGVEWGTDSGGGGGGGGGAIGTPSFLGTSSIGGTWTALDTSKWYAKRVPIPAGGLWLGELAVYLRRNSAGANGQIKFSLWDDNAGGTDPDHMIGYWATGPQSLVLLGGGGENPGDGRWIGAGGEYGWVDPADHDAIWIAVRTPTAGHNVATAAGADRSHGNSAGQTGVDWAFTNGSWPASADSTRDVSLRVSVIEFAAVPTTPLTIERFDAAAAPASPSAEDDEFEDESIGAGLTRVYNSGTPKGSWSEKYGKLAWLQTATSATELDVRAQARTISVGDYIEVCARLISNPGLMGIFIGFSNGTVFGTSNAVGTYWHSSGENNRFMLNPWPGHNSRGADGDIFDKYQLGDRWFVRVKYEAANTWGLYVSPNGHQWYTVDNNFAYTMTPTHVAFGVAMLNTGTAPPNWIEFDYVRVNAA